MWPLAVLTGDRTNGFFLIRKCIGVLPDRKKTSRDKEVTVLSRCP